MLEQNGHSGVLERTPLQAVVSAGKAAGAAEKSKAVSACEAVEK